MLKYVDVFNGENLNSADRKKIYEDLEKHKQPFKKVKIWALHPICNVHHAKIILSEACNCTGCDISCYGKCPVSYLEMDEKDCYPDENWASYWCKDVHILAIKQPIDTQIGIENILVGASREYQEQMKQKREFDESSYEMNRRESRLLRNSRKIKKVQNVILSCIDHFAISSIITKYLK